MRLERHRKIEAKRVAKMDKKEPKKMTIYRCFGNFYHPQWEAEFNTKKIVCCPICRSVGIIVGEVKKHGN